MYSKDNLSNLKKMDALAPDLMKTFWAFDRAAVAPGAIPVKYKELIAIAVALTTQCPYCIDIHSGNARGESHFRCRCIETQRQRLTFAPGCGTPCLFSPIVAGRAP
jgi:AhpD family alkylhydroperoxidase